MTTLTDTERVELRHLVLEILAVRQRAALPLHTVASHVRTARGLETPAADVEAALVLLAGYNPPLVLAMFDPLGNTRYWQATTAGVLAYERRA